MGALLRRLPEAHPHRPDRRVLNGRPGFLSGELHRGENAEILRLLRTAILRGHRPTTYLLHRQPLSKWSELDYTLGRAYQLFEDETSKEHGIALWLARSLDPEIMFVVEEREDRAAAALAEWDEKQPTDPKKRRKGITRHVVPYTTDGVPLEYGGLTRQQFREAAIQEEQDREEGIDLDRDRPDTGYDPAEYGDGLTDLP